ncbi:MAG: hypothetical protein BWY74_04443 [Firmicutes bacterium ADurb.Bin419]|nr:MAG: hypothetical protein BWY74_04443 [Firmicutes bacterium ADurb.Bin419]
MNLHILKITFEGNKIKSREIPRVRGFIASKFPEYLELHNHVGDKSYQYGYPMVQYKTFNGTPGVIAINEASSTLIKVFNDIDQLDLKEEVIDIVERGFIVKKHEFGTTDSLISYRFVSPWVALNQKNFDIYQKADDTGKVDILKKILVGNIISMSKYLGYTVDKQLMTLIKMKPIAVNFKNKEMIGFTGEFMINFEIPDYLGLGKSVSRGFGTIMRVKEGAFK